MQRPTGLKGALHGGLGQQAHSVNARAHGLEGREGTAQHVGAAGTGAQRGHAAAHRVLQRFVEGVDAVDGPQLGRHRVVILVVILAFVADGPAVQADVAVGLHQSGIDVQAGGVHHLRLRWRVKVLADGGDPAAVDQQVADKGRFMHRVVNEAVMNDRIHGGRLLPVCVLSVPVSY